MKTMIDRIADAVEEAMPPSELDGTKQARDFAVGMARTVLEAMREPTEAMIKANFSEAPQALGIWLTMIEEALAEHAHEASRA